MPMQVALMFFDATRDSKTGTLYVKVVNRAKPAASRTPGVERSHCRGARRTSHYNERQRARRHESDYRPDAYRASHEGGWIECELHPHIPRIFH